MSLIETYSGDEDDRRRLLRIDKLLQVRDTRVEFAKKHHRNTNGSPMDFRDPYLHDIYNSLSPRIALQASVQGQPLYSKVHTPNGWVEMGGLKEGSEISGCLGGTQLVERIHPLGKVSVYEIKLSDGRKTRATWDHQWLVSYDDYTSIVNTYELASLVVKGKVPYLPASSIPGSDYTESPSVVSVIYLDQINSQCITVSNSDSLYITDDYIVTHNCGKALALDCPVHTPSGWKRMGDIQLGDVVSTPDGRCGKVIGVFPQGIRTLYRLYLEDGRVVEADLDHLWKVFLENAGNFLIEDATFETLSTLQIMDRMGEEQFYLPVVEPIGTPLIKKIEYSRHAEAQCIAIDHPDKLYIMDQYVVTHNSEFLIIDHFAMAKCGLSILFVLPKYDLRNRFVQNRINKCVERIPEYSKIMGSGFFDSVQLKYFGGGTINYVGSNVEKDFYEIPTNCAIVDEYDNCHQENLRFVADRMSAATNLYPFIRWAGNPRFSNLGINQKFNESDKREWSVPCEKCGTINQLDWFKHVVDCVRDKMGNILSYELRDRDWKSGDKRDIYMLCESCGNPINRFSPQGLWIPTNPDGTYEGYHISKLFTRQASMVSMWKDFVKSTSNPSLMDWFYMSILGIPPSSQGNRVTPEIMAASARAKEFILAGNEAYVSEKVPGSCTMGIDVGSFLDVRISRVLAGKRVAVYLGRVNTQDEIYELMKRYNVEYAVIDCGPELHLVDEIQNSAPCSVWRCRFNSAEGKIQNISYDTSNMEIKVDRTFIMDRALAQLRRGKNILPKNYDSIFGGDYLKQMTNSVRERVLDPSGNERYEWLKTEDHHWLADCYDLLAADFMVDGTLTDIEVL